MTNKISFDLITEDDIKFDVDNFTTEEAFLPIMYAIQEAIQQTVYRYNKEQIEKETEKEVIVPDKIEITHELIFDTQRRFLTIHGTEVKLTTKEAELLQLLAMNLNNIVDRSYALKKIWTDDNYYNARSMDVYITKLRKILKPIKNIEIVNSHGKGYSLQVLN